MRGHAIPGTSYQDSNKVLIKSLRCFVAVYAGYFEFNN